MSRATRGYLLVAGSFLIMGMIGALVDWATAPESALLVLRFGTAGLVLGVVFARRCPLAGVASRSVWPRLLLMAVIDAFTLLLFFVAIRGTSVAIGMFLQFLAPVWVALIAPRILRARTEAIVYPALAIALAGLAVILAPSLLGEGIKLSPWGVTAGLFAGFGYAAFQLVVKDLTKRVSAVTIVFTEAWLDTLILLPLALWQTIGAGYHLTARDLVAGIILGSVCTALAYLMWTYGMGMIKVQHSSILGYLEPVSAPIYALLLLGQGISGWTVAGGALIVAAGLLVVLLGEHEEEGAESLEPAP
jgi:drug/metabolite transporter (DMT)-like permease